MMDWDEYRRQLATTITAIARTSPDVVKGYRQTSELIALAVAVTVRCDGCITTHVEAARRNGATVAEITDALSVAITVNAGAALVYSARTIDAFHASEEAATKT